MRHMRHGGLSNNMKLEDVLAEKIMEKASLQTELKIYPEKSFLHDFTRLAIAVCDFKVAMLETIIKYKLKIHRLS